MPAQVLSISDVRRAARSAAWSLLEVVVPGNKPEPLGILLLDEASGILSLRLRGAETFAELDEEAADFLTYLAADLRGKSLEMGGAQLLESLEDSLSGFLRISDRTAISYTGDPGRAVDRLFDQHVDGEVRPGVTHIPVYALRAAATKFGEGMSAGEEEWIRTPENLRVTPDLFAAWVVGRSMEPLIPDGSLCVFRANVTGTRQGKRLLIEKFDETDFAARYTVKRYKSEKKQTADGWEHQLIRLEPLNPEFEAFELRPDAFRVIGEFVEVLDS